MKHKPEDPKESKPASRIGFRSKSEPEPESEPLPAPVPAADTTPISATEPALTPKQVEAHPAFDAPAGTSAVPDVLAILSRALKALEKLPPAVAGLPDEYKSLVLPSDLATVARYRALHKSLTRLHKA